MDKGNQQQLLESIFVDLVRKIRKRRCPQVARKIMSALIEHHEERSKMHGELLKRFKERDNDFGEKACAKLEEEKEDGRKEELTIGTFDRQRVLDAIHLDLLRRIRNHKLPHLAKKILRRLDEHEDRLQRIHEEFLIRFKERNNKSLNEAIRKLEEEINLRRKVSMDKGNQQQLLESIFVDLVRKIRKRRCPQVARKIMSALIEHHEERSKMHIELLERFKERDNDLGEKACAKLEKEKEDRRKEELEKENRARILKNILVDLVRRIRTRQCPQMAKKIMRILLEHHHKRGNIHKELINEVKWQKMEMEACQSSKNLKTAVYAIPEAIFLKTFLFVNIPKVFFPKYFVNLSI
ncbi:uncharacterized protein LOC144624806 [Crassostrea virginica]